MAPMWAAIRARFLDDKFILTLIGVNLVVLFAQSFSALPRETRTTLEHIDDVFTLLFVVEAIIKIRTSGWRAYIGQRWNQFDFVLVVVALPTILAWFLPIEHSSNVLLAARALRAFKSFRTIRFLGKQVEKILEGVRRAIDRSLALIAGLVLGLVVVSIISCRLFGDVAPEYYGDPIVALYSTFKIFTVEGWFDIPDAVADRLDGTTQMATRVFFSAVLLICGVLGLSLVNSVFVDAMVEDNNKGLEDKVEALKGEIQELRRLLGGGATPRELADPKPEPTREDA